MSTEVSHLLLEWYNKYKRELPWRESKDPYLIWISEIILQQTRVAQGYDYYVRFVKRFPNVQTLSEASEEEVLKYWQGLGYYSRARNLHAAAHTIMSQFGGVFPDRYEDVLSLKGIGTYTAAAIVSFAWNQPYPVVDGNVFRVLTRLYAIDTPIDTAKGKKTVTDIASSLIDIKCAGLFNQAIMEFGALQCTPSAPLCGTCPFSHLCHAFAEGNPGAYPVKKNKVKVRDRYFNYFHIIYKNGLFIHRRKGKDIWQGLFELPLIETESLVELPDLYSSDAFQALFSNSGDWTLLESVLNVKHVLSHQILYTSFYRVEISDPTALKEQYLYISFNELEQYAIPRLIHQYLFPD